jgi:hypothetical protein
VTIAAIYAVSLPPLIEAFRQLQNRPKILWFAGFFVLPFVYVVLFAGFFLENYLLLDRRVLARTIIGVPYLILVVEVVSLIVYEAFRSYVARPWELRSAQMRV